MSELSSLIDTVLIHLSQKLLDFIPRRSLAVNLMICDQEEGQRKLIHRTPKL